MTQTTFNYAEAIRNQRDFHGKPTQTYTINGKTIKTNFGAYDYPYWNGNDIPMKYTHKEKCGHRSSNEVMNQLIEAGYDEIRIVVLASGMIRGYCEMYFLACKSKKAQSQKSELAEMKEITIKALDEMQEAFNKAEAQNQPETAPETESKEMNQPEPEKVTESHTEPQRELIKVDKNGTKYWRQMVRCSKCGGSGSLAWTDYADGVCFDCHGAGEYEEITKEYTPEHQAKLEAQRAKRLEKKLAEERAKAHELNLKFFERNGFDAEGNIWCILGDTYSIREQLKELGCKFNYSSLGWHCDHELDGFPQIKLTASQICNQNENGIFVSWKNEELSQLVSEAQEAIKEKEPESNYVGAVGDKIEITATFKREISYQIKIDWMTQTKRIFIFADESGNQLTWNTTAFIDAQAGDQVKLKGTIKAHKEYKGIKQTELQRCKITKEVA